MTPISQQTILITGATDGLVQTCKHGGHVVALHLEHVPAEGFPLGVEVAQGHHIIHVTVDLATVPVHGGNEVVHLLACSRDGSLPDLPFLQFAIAMQGENEGRIAVELLGQCRADAALAAGIFHRGELTVAQVKAVCLDAGLPIRPPTGASRLVGATSEPQGISTP